MNNTITLSKQPGASYRAHAFKVYDVTRNGEVVGTVESDFEWVGTSRTPP